MKANTKKLFLTIFITVFISRLVVAQKDESSGWFFLSHSQKINSNWSYMMDIQLRTIPTFRYLKNVLVRPGLIYNINDQHAVGLGYTYFATWDKTKSPHTFEPENRIFEQYTAEIKFGRLKVSNRFRLEQRFIQKTTSTVFAQRFRHQIQAKFRLNGDSSFKKGWYLNLQNEIFLNIQHKEKINDHFIDQNRPYIGIGYRIEKIFELEFGSYYRYQIKADSQTKEQIFQLMIITNL